MSDLGRPLERRRTLGVGGEITVPPGRFGRLEKGVVAEKVVGVWTFNGPAAREEPGESTVPAEGRHRRCLQ
ncbi:hypothetical protein ACFQ67_01290 [Streptomyces sp. NPDC056488]|uniref:hypothetical protein n=1 Tax=unclassified Streptomyces TaxID=2593676 RepID=UPI0036AF23BA